jgi:hypothetical protein
MIIFTLKVIYKHGSPIIEHFEFSECYKPHFKIGRSFVHVPLEQSQVYLDKARIERMEMTWRQDAPGA